MCAGAGQQRHFICIDHHQWKPSSETVLKTPLFGIFPLIFSLVLYVIDIASPQEELNAHALQSVTDPTRKGANKTKRQDGGRRGNLDHSGFSGVDNRGRGSACVSFYSFWWTVYFGQIQNSLWMDLLYFAHDEKRARHSVSDRSTELHVRTEIRDCNSANVFTRDPFRFDPACLLQWGGSHRLAVL